MISVVLYFALAGIISFVGSLQPGPVNMAVVAAAANKSYRNALFIAIGGSIPECIFSGVALFASTYIVEQKNFFEWFNYFLIAVFFIAGIFLILSKNKEGNMVFKRKGFVLGFWLASVNPQLIFFWLSVFTLLQKNGYPIVSSDISVQLSFLLGTSVGAFILHYILIKLVEKYEATEVVNFIAQKANKIIGYLLLIIGLWQLILFMIK